MNPTWVQWVFSVACLTVGVHFAVALITRWSQPAEGRRGAAGIEYELSHLGMALGMAAMFAPPADPVPRPVWVAVFGVAAAWFASRALRAGSRTRVVEYHLVGNLAMLFMLVASHHHHGAAGAPGGPVAPGHEGHAGAGSGGLLDGPLGTVLSVVLIGYFAVHAVRSLLVFAAAGSTRSQAPAATPLGPEVAGGAAVGVVTRGRVVERLRVEAGCHVVMNVAMTVMFGMMLWP